MFTRARLTRWTSALRANPEQQITGMLINESGTGMCCLGKLCEVEGLKTVLTSPGERFVKGFYFPSEDSGYGTGSNGILHSKLASEFGNSDGKFEKLDMPRLDGWSSAAAANDNGCSWIEIADHFDLWYPCSDEPCSRGVAMPQLKEDAK